MFKKSVIIFLAKNNYSQREYLQTRRILEKAGIMIFVASDSIGVCNGNNGLKVSAEMGLFNIHAKNFNAIIIIGGEGIRDYWSNVTLHSILRKFHDNKKVIAAICSAPIILARAGLLYNENATCFAKDEYKLTAAGAIYQQSSIVISDNIITASAEENSIEFAKAIIANILSK